MTLAPPPQPTVLPLSVASTSTNNTGHGTINASLEQNKKKRKKKIEDLGDQVVPQGKRSNKRPVIVHCGLDAYYRSRVDAPVIRYNNTNDDNGNEDRQTSQAGLDGSQDNPIFVE